MLETHQRDVGETIVVQNPKPPRKVLDAEDDPERCPQVNLMKIISLGPPSEIKGIPEEECTG